MGGSARSWSGSLPIDPAQATQVEGRIVMTKFGAPAVRIGYELVVGP